ncbi:MAG: phosphoadenosine phosphosulfate reductase family protein [Bacteroidia bacterium]|nr:phosphoadenosine phosphosulfate reductase family protein [Bacteroidia bacterium]
MIQQKQLDNLNRNLANAQPEEIINSALQHAKNPVITTNFRPYEVAILYAVTRVKADIPVIWCDTGYNTVETYRHIAVLQDLLNLNLDTFVPQQSSAHREAVMGIPTIEDPRHSLFTEQVKLEPFRRAMNAYQPDVWFTNLRQGQTAFRDSLETFNLDKNGIAKVCPFYRWSDRELDRYLAEFNLPNEHRYFDPTKVLSNRECGLHV